MEWQDWADSLLLLNYAIRTTADPDLEWRDFATRLGEFEACVPTPDFFETWEEWAEALKLANLGHVEHP